MYIYVCIDFVNTELKRIFQRELNSVNYFSLNQLIFNDRKKIVTDHAFTASCVPLLRIVYIRSLSVKI